MDFDVGDYVVAYWDVGTARRYGIGKVTEKEEGEEEEDNVFIWNALCINRGRKLDGNIYPFKPPKDNTCKDYLNVHQVMAVVKNISKEDATIVPSGRDTHTYFDLTHYLNKVDKFYRLKQEINAAYLSKIYKIFTMKILNLLELSIV